MVLLRLFTEDELPYFDALPGDADDPFSWFGFRGAAGATVRHRWQENRFVAEDHGTLAVDDGGAVVGDVSWHVVRYGPPPMSNAANIGIRINPAHQRHGHGTAAQQALTRYLFATYPLNRVEAQTDVMNVAEQRSLQKAGFTREGVLRGAQWRDGRWNDLVCFARVRTDP